MEIYISYIIWRDLYVLVLRLSMKFSQLSFPLSWIFCRRTWFTTILQRNLHNLINAHKNYYFICLYALTYIKLPFSFKFICIMPLSINWLGCQIHFYTGCVMQICRLYNPIHHKCRAFCSEFMRPAPPPNAGDVDFNRNLYSKFYSLVIHMKHLS